MKPGAEPWQRHANLASTVALLIILGMGASSWRAYAVLQQRAWEVAEANADRVGVALRSDILRSLRAAAAALDGMVRALALLEDEPLDLATRRALLLANAPQGPAYSATLVTDAAGRIIYDTRSDRAGGVNRAGHEYFTFHRDHPGAGRHLSAPFRAISDGRWLIALSQRIATPDGSFAGVVASILEIGYLQSLFAEVRIGPHGSVALLRTDGVLLMRAPFNPAEIGGDMLASPVFEAWRTAGGKPFTARAMTDGEERRHFVTTFYDFPLALLVNVAAADVRAGLGAVPLRIGLGFAVLAGTLFCVVGLFRHEIARRAAAEAEAREGAVILQIIADNSPDMITIVGPDGRRRFVSEGSRHVFGVPPETLQGGTAHRLAVPEDQPAMSAVMERLARGETDTASTRYRARHADGHLIWVETIGRVVKGSGKDGRFTLVGIIRDVTAATAREAELAEDSLRDPLTDLLNRGGFAAALAAATAAGGAATVIAIDLDHFKEVNDAEGHAAGDAVLSVVAERLRTAVRSDDSIARLGGDEFALLLPGLADHQVIESLAERIQATLHAPVPWQGRALRLGATLGIARVPQDAASAEAALPLADAALIRAKQEARGSIGLAGGEDAALLARRVAIRRSFGLASGSEDLPGLAVAMQPILRCADAAAEPVLAIEAFARWTHPGLGPVPPGELLAQLAPEQAVQLGRAARRLALAEFAALRRAGCAAGRLALNLSAAEVLRPEVMLLLEEQAAEAGLTLADLALEVTEAVLVERVSDRGLEQLAGLRRRGAQLWLDDFGTGHADLPQLLRLPLDAVKLDRSFIRALGEDARAEALVRATVALAHGLELAVIAEGVETEAQAAALRGLGCDALQGYLLARPMPAAALGAWLERDDARRLRQSV